MSKAFQRSDFGSLGRDAKKKLTSDNDIKIIIQGENSQTGIGKTTLAIQLCRYIDNTDEGWDAKEKAFVDVQKYLNAHINKPKQSALLLDEIEANADRRRSMSNENVNLSKGWATLRARQIATVATLPTISMLDARMLELADYWILVRKRGVAQPYKVVVNDFAPHKTPQRKPLPGKEHIQFVDLPANDPDKRYLDKIKDEMTEGDSLQSVPQTEHKKKLKKTKKKTEKQIRDKMIRDIYNEFDVSYADISNLPTVDLQRQTVGEVVREEV